MRRVGDGRGSRLLGALVAFALVGAVLLPATSTPAAADTAPVDPTLPETVSAAALPTVQINGVVWAQVIVGNRVYATGEFTKARPAGAALGTNETTRSNILAYDLTTGNLITSWAPTLNAQGLAIAASADGSTIYVGGDFDQVSGQWRSRIAALDAQTGAVKPFNPGANTTVASLALNAATNTLYYGGYFTSVGNSDVGTTARSRAAAVDATTGALKPWAPATDREILAMVVHPASGRVILGGNFNTINGAANRGMGSVDGMTGAVMPWAANNTIQNYGDSSAIGSLTTDGTKIYGAGWAFFGGGATANFEGAFGADPLTGNIIWVDGGRGDNYDIATANGVVYMVGHPHDWGMLDWNPQYPGDSSQWKFQRTTAIDADPSPTLYNAYGSDSKWKPFQGMRAAQPLHWLPTLTGGSYTGQSQAAWSVATNGDYVVEGGEFPRVNGINQQGLVRFAKRTISPTVDPIQSYGELTPTLTGIDAGTVRVGWTAAWDRDNEQLTVDVLRGPTTATATVLTSFPTHTTWWNRPPLGFTDATATPGSSQTYRIRATDPFGNSVTGPPATITVPSGTAPASQYAASVLLDKPDWQWRLGETSGTTAYDRSDSNDLTLNSSVQRNQAGALLNDADPAVTFPGTSSTATVQGVSPYWQPGPQTFSLEAWVKTSTSSGGKIIGFGDSNTQRSSSDGNDRTLYMTNSGQIRFGVRPDMGTRITVNSPLTYRDNQWHQVVGTLGADGMKLYVDGSLVATNSSVTKAQTYRGYWRVGGDRLSSWPSAPSREAINASIDEVAVYPSALSASRVLAHYTSSGRGTPPPNQPPTAGFTAGTSYNSATFTSTSTDTDGAIVSSVWDFGDGATDSGASTSHTYAAGGTYTVKLTVTDDDGATDSTSQSVTVTDPPPEFAIDTFERTVSGGFGPADVGGVWSISGVASDFSVSSGSGQVTASPGQTRAAYLDVGQRDVDMTLDATLDRTPTGGGAYLSVVGRHVANDRDYRIKLRYMPDGTVVGYLTRNLDGAVTVLANSTIPGLTVTPGQALRIRFQVQGSTSTTLRTKVWKASSAQPTDWALTATDTTPAALQATGGIGALLYTSGSWTGTPPTIAIDNVDAGPIGGGPPPPPNVAPTAEFTSSTAANTATLTSTSTDSDGTITSTAWDFGDSTTGTGTPATHAYTAAGTYNVTLTVTDDDGATGTVTHPVTVTDPPPPPVNVAPTAEFTSSTAANTATLTSTSTDSDGTITSTAWDFGDSTTGTGTPATHAYTAAGTYNVTLTVTDDDGATGTVTHPVTVTDPPPPPVDYALDAFGRTLTGGFGTADLGGAWTLSGVAADFSVSNGTGRITSAPGASRGAYLGIGQRDVDLDLDLALDRAPTGGGAYLSVIGRRVSNNNDYRVKLRYMPDGRVIAYLVRTLAGAETVVANAPVPDLTVAAGESISVRLQVEGTTTTTLRTRVWKTATTEPTGWNLTATDATPAALQAPGGVGALLYTSGSWSGTPPTIAIDNLEASPLPA